MLEQIILGITQGIAEWLPVSSEGLIFLIKANFFPSGDFADIARLALWLHGGTFLAALVYFRKEVGRLVRALINFKKAATETQLILKFLIITTFISGLIGLVFYFGINALAANLELGGKTITAAVGCLLLITAVLQLKSPGHGYRQATDLKLSDGILLGLAQGLAALPGLSRSGLTVSTLLLKKFDKQLALKLSFLMSLPIVFLGNIVLNFGESFINLAGLAALAAAFIFGLLTIKILMRLAEKINFGIFVLIFALLTFISLAI